MMILQIQKMLTEAGMCPQLERRAKGVYYPHSNPTLDKPGVLHMLCSLHKYEFLTDEELVACINRVHDAFEETKFVWE